MKRFHIRSTAATIQLRQIRLFSNMQQHCTKIVNSTSSKSIRGNSLGRDTIKHLILVLLYLNSTHYTLHGDIIYKHVSTDQSPIAVSLHNLLSAFMENKETRNNSHFYSLPLMPFSITSNSLRR